MSGTLYVVATPIGNLEDLSPRARQTLAAVDLIASEDTRRTGRLLSAIGVEKRQKALHDHNESAVVAGLIDMLQSGADIALVSDAGTPLVSDPGYRLVAAAHANGIAVSPVPGPSAVTAALSAAGLPTDRFCFEGFVPSRAAARAEWLAARSTESRTLVFFESPHRIADSVAAMRTAFGDERVVFIGRELSKLYEQCVQGTLAELHDKLNNAAVPEKGEFVIVVHGSNAAQESNLEIDALLRELTEHLPARTAASIASRVTGEKKNALYARLLELQGGHQDG